MITTEHSQVRASFEWTCWSEPAYWKVGQDSVRIVSVPERIHRWKQQYDVEHFVEN